MRFINTENCLNFYIFVFLIIHVLVIGCKKNSETQLTECSRIISKPVGQPYSGYRYINGQSEIDTIINSRTSNGYLITSYIFQHNAPELIGVFNKTNPRKKSQSHLFIAYINPFSNTLDTIFSAKNTGYIEPPQISYGDSLLAFIATIPSYSSQRILIMNILNENTIIKEIIFPYGIVVHMNEEAWRNDNTELVYATRSTLEKENPSLITSVEGIFRVNIKNESKERIDISGQDPAWSSDGEKIAYIKNNSIWIYNTRHKSKEKVYGASGTININAIHWNPCNPNELVVMKWESNIFGSGSSQIVVNVIDGHVTAIGLDVLKESSFSWRKNR